MALEILLVSSDPDTTRTLQRVMQELGIDMVLTPTTSEATDLLPRRKFDALIIDCDSLPDAQNLLARLRQGGSNRTAIIFAVLSGNNALQRGFGLGANFVLEKPVTVERAIRSTRAALGLMVRERRRYFRLEVEVPVTIDVGDGTPRTLKTTNISEGGFAIRAAQPLPVGGKVRVRLDLSGQTVDCRGEIAWSTEDGRCGVRLVAPADSVRQQLAAFVAANCGQMLPMVSNSARGWTTKV